MIDITLWLMAFYGVLLHVAIGYLVIKLKRKNKPIIKRQSKKLVKKQTLFLEYILSKAIKQDKNNPDWYWTNYISGNKIARVIKCPDSSVWWYANKLIEKGLMKKKKAKNGINCYSVRRKS